jgi:hypothetical protein
MFFDLSLDAWGLVVDGIALLILVSATIIAFWRWAIPGIRGWRQGRTLRLEFPSVTDEGYIPLSGPKRLVLECGEQTITAVVTFGKAAYVKEVLFEFVQGGIIVSDTIVDIHRVTKEVEDPEPVMSQVRQFPPDEPGDSVGITFVSARRLEKNTRLLFTLSLSAYLPWRGYIRANVLDATNRRWYGKAKIEIKES